jgi:hypothetical protein
MNFVMDETGAFIELQGTGEGRAFTRSELNEILVLGEKGINELHAVQRKALGERAEVISPRRTLVIASNNAHKIQEIAGMVGDRLRVISMGEAGFTDDIDEHGDLIVASYTGEYENIMGLPVEPLRRFGII